MQNNEQSLLLTHRENYIVPKGQEQAVHCKIVKLDSAGNFLEKCKLIRVGLKKFETIIKNNLEIMGYSVEILYHPMGKYSNVVIKDKDVEIASRDLEIATKDDEIARLQREIAEMQNAVKVVDKKASNEEGATEVGATDGAEPKDEKKKGGRPKSKKEE